MAQTVTVNIIGDAASLNRALGQADARLSAFADKAQAVGARATSIGRSMSVGVTLPLVAMGKAAFDAASDLNESMSKADQIFGGNAAAIHRWAEGAARDFGQSKQQAEENAASFGNMFRQLGLGLEPATKMSRKMVELASDFASFHNADISEVLLAQQAAFRGEYDALQRFVPTINAAAVQTRAMADTGKDNAVALTDQEKAVAAYALMVEGAGKATGDFDRTSGGAANQLRIMQAEIDNSAAKIGAKLLPIVVQVASFVSQLADGFAALPGPVQDVALAFAALLAAVGPASFVFGAFSKLAGGIASTMGALHTLFQLGAVRALEFADALKTMSLAQIAAGAAATVGIIAIGALIVALGSADGPYERIAAAAERWGKAQINAAKSSGDEFRALSATSKALEAHIADLKAEQMRYSDAITGGQAGAQGYKDRLVEVSTQLEVAQAKHKVLVPEIAKLRGEMEAAKAAEQARKVAIKDLADGTTNLTTATDEAKQAIQDLQSAVLAASGGELGLQQSRLNLTEAEQAFTKAVQEHGPASEEAVAAELNLQQARLGVASATLNAQDASQKLLDIVHQGPDAVQAEINKLKEAQTTYGDTSGAIQEQIDKLFWLSLSINGLPPQKGVTITVDTIQAQQAVDALIDRIQVLTGKPNLVFVDLVTGADGEQFGVVGIP